jgi:hypothetical protein
LNRLDGGEGSPALAHWILFLFRSRRRRSNLHRGVVPWPRELLPPGTPAFEGGRPRGRNDSLCGIDGFMTCGPRNANGELVCKYGRHGDNEFTIH